MQTAIENKGLRGPVPEGVFLHLSARPKTGSSHSIPHNRRRLSGLGQISRQFDADDN